MNTVTILNQEEVIKVLDMSSTIRAVENAYVFNSTKQAELYPLICKMYDNGGEFDIKSGECSGEKIFGLKLVCGFPENVKIGLPRSNGIIVVYDLNNGLIHGIVDGVYITKIRTGAAGAIGAKYLARKQSETLMILGTGRMALAEIAATLEVMDNIKKVIICNPRNKEKAVDFANNTKQKLIDEYISTYKNTEYYNTLLKKCDIEYTGTDDTKAACSESDIIITVTNAHESLINSDWIKSGTHISCIGADMPGKQELDENIMPKARLYADSISQVISVGEMKAAYNKKLIQDNDIIEIGNVINGSAQARISDNDITVFDSTGIAIQDLLTADAAISLAKERNIGTNILL